MFDNFSCLFAAAQRAAGEGIVLFVPRQKGRKNAPKGRMPFGFPQCAVAGEINLAARRKSRQLQILCLQVKKTCKHGSCSDFAFANNVSFCLFPCDRRDFKQNGKAKSFAKLTHLRGGIYATQMEEVCKGNTPDGHKRPAGWRGFPGGTPGFPSWLLLGKRQEVASKPVQRTREAV